MRWIVAGAILALMCYGFAKGWERIVNYESQFETRGGMYGLRDH